MNDLISRQDVINALLTIGFVWDDELSEPEKEELDYAIHGFVMAYKEMIEALPSAQPEQRWIPCNERLPEQYGNYLVSIEGEEPDIGTINPNDPRGWSLCDANGFHWASDKMLNVTAWMPLPEPYKEG